MHKSHIKLVLHQPSPLNNSGKFSPYHSEQLVELLPRQPANYIRFSTEDHFRMNCWKFCVEKKKLLSELASKLLPKCRPGWHVHQISWNVLSCIWLQNILCTLQSAEWFDRPFNNRCLSTFQTKSLLYQRNISYSWIIFLLHILHLVGKRKFNVYVFIVQFLTLKRIHFLGPQIQL